MTGAPRITLEQWRALQAVVEEGGYAQAAEKLHKSQSTVTYAVQQIQKLLDVQVFEIRGRKAVLTDGGKVLYRRTRTAAQRTGGPAPGPREPAGPGGAGRRGPGGARRPPRPSAHLRPRAPLP